MTGTVINKIGAYVTVTSLPLVSGGIGDSLTANNGGILYSSGSAGEILSGTATAKQILLSGSNTTPYWSTATYPTTITANELLYSSANNVVGGLATTATRTFVSSSGTLTWTLALPYNYGGINNAAITASNGGIIWSASGDFQLLNGTATANQLLLSGNAAAPSWSTTKYPSTNAANTLLYASATNQMAALATANNSCLVTSGTGVPSISSTLPAAVVSNIPGRLVSKQILTSGTGATYTATAGTTSILVECLGGGGGGGGSLGGGSTYAAAGGGGAGGYSRFWIASSSATYTYTVGGGGAGGVAGNNAGTTGTTSSFSTISAAGGVGGAGSGGVSVAASALAIGGNGGAGASGTVNAHGGAGTYGISALGNTISGNGGNSYLGSGAIGIVSAAAGNNANANSGAGGSGAVSTTASKAGGNGGSGVIIVWEFA